MSIIKTKEGLQRVVGIPGLSLAIVNGIIGAGIFVLPAIVNLKLGAFSIVGYIFCIIMLAAILLCYAEIGSRVTTSGGSYAYVEAAFGPFPAYVINWLFFFWLGHFRQRCLDEHHCRFARDIRTHTFYSPCEK